MNKSMWFLTFIEDQQLVLLCKILEQGILTYKFIYIFIPYRALLITSLSHNNHSSMFISVLYRCVLLSLCVTISQSSNYAGA